MNSFLPTRRDQDGSGNSPKCSGFSRERVTEWSVLSSYDTEVISSVSKVEDT